MERSNPYPLLFTYRFCPRHRPSSTIFNHLQSLPIHLQTSANICNHWYPLTATCKHWRLSWRTSAIVCNYLSLLVNIWRIFAIVCDCLIIGKQTESKKSRKVSMPYAQRCKKNRRERLFFTASLPARIILQPKLIGLVYFCSKKCVQAA